MEISSTLSLVFRADGSRQWNGVVYDEVHSEDYSSKANSVGTNIGKVATAVSERDSIELASIENSIEQASKKHSIGKNCSRNLNSPRQMHSACIQKISSPRSTGFVEKKQISLLEKQISHLKDLQNKSNLLKTLKAKGEIDKLHLLIAQWEDGCCQAVEAFKKHIPDESQANAALRGLFAAFDLDPASLDIDIGQQQHSQEEPKESSYYYDD